MKRLQGGTLDLLYFLLFSIILLEDVDAAFADRDAELQTRVTFSGLLNAIGIECCLKY